MRLWPLLVVCASLVVCDYPQDPYGTLGLRKGASIKDVKRAYKSLAREWHPDKNDSPGANEKFVSINKAYELLSDPNKKERYDKYGAFDDTPGGSPQYQQYGGFDHFFGGFGGFGGFERSDSYFQKHKISLRLFAHTIQEKSHQQPFILFAYSGYCQLCYRVEPIWQSVVEDLEPLGYGVGTISAMTDGNLLEKLRVTHLPTIMVLVEGRVVHYRGNMPNLNARSVRIFARDVIPKTFISTINTHDKLKRFVDLWRSSNKVSVLILGATPEPRLRYSLAAMKFSPTARFAYVHLGDSSAEVQEMRQALDIKCTQCENILIFNDTPDRGPVGRLSISSANQLTVDALERLINEHKFVTLPRLSSTVYLDDLCTVSSRNQRHLCVILVVMDGSEDAQYVESFRQFVSVRKQRMTAEKITAVYIYADRQTEWLRPFLAERSGPVESSARDVLVMWRYEHVKARFAWLKGAWQKSGSDAALDAHIEQVVRNGIKLNDVASVGKLVDEHAPWWLVRLSHRLVRMLETLWFHMTKEEVYPILSVVGTFLCVFFGSYLFKYLSRPSEKKRFTPSTSDEWHPDDPETVDKEALARKDPSTKIRKIMAQMKPLMHELRAESYYGMVRLLKPGCRSIIVLLDEEHKEVLLEQFARSVHPLRNNKTFSFGYLMVEKNLPWFRKLLEHTLPLNNDEQPKEGPSMYERLKTINPRQTIGTVLVLCGWKLYFSIYHPMHAPANKKQFLGFDDDGEDADEYSDDDEDLDETASLRRSFRGVNVDNVMNGFGNWLERLLEGSIRRYYIPEWPENLK